MNRSLESYQPPGILSEISMKNGLVQPGFVSGSQTVPDIKQLDQHKEPPKVPENQEVSDIEIEHTEPKPAPVKTVVVAENIPQQQATYTPPLPQSCTKFYFSFLGCVLILIVVVLLYYLLNSREIYSKLPTKIFGTHGTKRNTLTMGVIIGLAACAVALVTGYKKSIKYSPHN